MWHEQTFFNSTHPCEPNDTPTARALTSSTALCPILAFHPRDRHLQVATPLCHRVYALPQACTETTPVDLVDGSCGWQIPRTFFFPVGAESSLWNGRAQLDPQELRERLTQEKGFYFFFFSLDGLISKREFTEGILTFSKDQFPFRAELFHFAHNVRQTHTYTYST